MDRLLPAPKRAELQREQVTSQITLNLGLDSDHENEAEKSADSGAEQILFAVLERPRPPFPFDAGQGLAVDG